MPSRGTSGMLLYHKHSPHTTVIKKFKDYLCKNYLSHVTTKQPAT